HVAAQGLDAALVADGRRRRPGEEQVAASQETGVRQIERGGGETLRVHLPAGADHDAVGVDDDDAAIGLEGTVDFSRIAGKHTVQGDGGGGGLEEFDDVTLADGKLLPVD